MGIIIAPEDEEALYRAISENLDKDSALIKARARKFAEEELSIGKILNKLELTLLAFNRNLKS